MRKARMGIAACLALGVAFGATAWLIASVGDLHDRLAKVSPSLAVGLVAFAVEKNLIRVRVDHQLADCLALADQLSKRYGLSMCEVVPVDNDKPDEIDRKLAVAGAQVMERYLSEDRPMVVAVSSGRTLKAVVDQVAQLDRPQHRLVSMVGAIAQLYEVYLRKPTHVAPA